MANTVDIHDFILGNDATEVRVERPKVQPELTVVLLSGIDLVVERKTPRKTSQMVLLLSQGQFYIKEGTKINPLTSARAAAFMRDTKGMYIPDAVVDYLPVKPSNWDYVLNTIRNPDFLRLAKKGLATLLSWSSESHYLYDNKLKGCNLMQETAFVKRLLSVFEKNIPGLSHADVLRLFFYVPRSYDEYAPNIFEVCLNKADPAHRMRVRKLNETAPMFYFLLKHIPGFSEDDVMSFVEQWFLNDLLGSVKIPDTHMPFFDKTEDGLMKLRDGTAVPRYGAPASIALSEYAMVAFNPRLCIEYMLNEPISSGYCGDAFGSGFFSVWNDTLRMQKIVYGEIRDKYPANLPVVHNILTYKTSVVKQKIDEEKWEQSVARAKAFEGSANGYVLIAPEKPIDLTNEGIRNHNCVASYISAMTSGASLIMFLRKKATPDESCCTVEINPDNKVVQFRGFGNRKPNPNEEDALRAIGKNVGFSYEASYF